eukprot:Amastigsp_a177262_24.p1 type:complete len:301 gc:universal Amastigsp_a177262_24:1-903(+)
MGRLGFFDTLLKLFFESPCNNALHNVVTDILESVVRKAESEGGSMVTVEHLLTDCGLVDKLLDTAARDAERAAARKGFRGGNMAHVHLIANNLSAAPKVSAKLAAQPRWLTFVAGTLEPWNLKNATPIAGGGRPQSYSDAQAVEQMHMLSSAPSSLEDLQQILSSFLGSSGRSDLSSFVDVENFMDDEDDYEDDDDPAASGVPRLGAGAAAPTDRYADGDGDGDGDAAFGAGDEDDFEFGPDRVARLGDDSFGMETIEPDSAELAPSDGGPVERLGHSDDEADVSASASAPAPVPSPPSL